ncbi:MAG TPA: FG-GAP-like repeat-containing protein, partial [Polyangiaceae bacterium]|nr:FG-GAP-like repeat-containing protein [Polyangiaceae bacterium]
MTRRSGSVPSRERPRPRHVAALRFATIPFAVLTPWAAMSAGCGQDPVGVDVVRNENGDEQIPEGDTELIERCGSTGIKCGDGCCAPGNICSDYDRCIPDTSCETNAQCSADSQCAQGRCVPWSILPAGSQFSRACRNTVDLPSVVPEVQCSWPGDTLPAVNPNQVQVIGTPMVVDFNSDGDPSTRHPSIVFISYEGPFATNTGVIRVIDGETCELQDTITGEFPFTPEVPLALGDINNDGKPDIIAADEQPLGAATRSGIAVFELASSGSVPKFQAMQRGRVQSSGTGTITGFALGDVDNDDFPEIFTEKTMLRYDEAFKGLVNVAPIVPSGHSELTNIEPPAVVDIDGDRQSEVVTPQGAFTWDTLNNVFINKSRSLDSNDPLWRPDPLIDLNGAFMGMANLRPDWSTGLPQG